MDDTKTFEFELVGPESRVIDGPMWQVVMPGTEGEFGVRAGHCALVASLRPGVVSFWRSIEEDIPKKIFVGGGFAHVNDRICTVLVEEAVNLADLDEDDLKQELEDLQDERSLAEDAADRTLIDEKIELVTSKMLAVKFYR